MDDIILALRKMGDPTCNQAADELDRFCFLSRNPIQVTRYQVGDVSVEQQPCGRWAVVKNNMSIAQDGSVWQTVEKVNTFPLHAALRLAERERSR